MLVGAIAYFVWPAGCAAGDTRHRRAAVLTMAIKLVASHVKPVHREAREAPTEL